MTNSEELQFVEYNYNCMGDITVLEENLSISFPMERQDHLVIRVRINKTQQPVKVLWDDKTITSNRFN